MRNYFEILKKVSFLKRDKDSEKKMNPEKKLEKIDN